MLRRMMTAMLASVMVIALALPANAQADQEEVTVLQSQRTGSYATYYYYDENGNCIRKENPGKYTEYAYNKSGVLAAEKNYSGGKVESQLSYDAYGNPVDDGGITEYTMEYDTYGRLSFYTSADAQNRNNPKTNIRYEYSYGPVSVSFGQYEQDGNPDNGPEDIEWIVLDTDGNKLLLISKYLLDSREYHQGKTKATWKNSTLRSWLNGEFLKEAFDYGQRYQIQSTKVLGNVEDKVFLLSQEQAEKYFANDSDRCCSTLEEARKQAGKSGWWFLCTTGKTTDKIMGVKPDGSLDKEGKHALTYQGGVRPAMWVSNTVMGGSQDQVFRKHVNITYFDTEEKKELTIESAIYTYDDAGNLICYQDYMNGDMFEWDYDSKNRETAYLSLSGFGKEERITTYTDNELGQTLRKDVAITKTGQDKKTSKYQEYTQYAYDAQNRLTSQTYVDEDGRMIIENWLYQDAENTVVHSVVEEGKKTKISYMTYDSENRLVKLQENGRLTEYTYVPLSEALWKGKSYDGVKTQQKNQVPYTTSLLGTDPIYAQPDGSSRFVRNVGTKGIYTIVEEAYDSQGNLWGKLKSGLGWVMLIKADVSDERFCPQCGRREPEAMFVSYAEPGSLCMACSYDNIHGGPAAKVYCPECGSDCTYRGLESDGLCGDCSEESK